MVKEIEKIVEDFNAYRKLSKNHLSGYIYFISDGEFVKVGIADRPAWRMAMLQTGNPRKLELLFTIPVFDNYHRAYQKHENALRMEKAFHLYFKKLKCHVRGEWYDILKYLDVLECRKKFGCETERYLMEVS